jgi:CDP-6-deoxy-D-xylo-4-hexulose-3-dehydrase
MTARADELRKRILELVSEYYDEAFGEGKFVPGESLVPVAGRVFDAADMQSLTDSALDFWLTSGRFAAQFEKSFARYCGVRGRTSLDL